MDKREIEEKTDICSNSKRSNRCPVESLVNLRANLYCRQ